MMTGIIRSSAEKQSSDYGAEWVPRRSGRQHAHAIRIESASRAGGS